MTKIATRGSARAGTTGKGSGTIEETIYVHARDGDLLLSGINEDLLHTVKKILQEGMTEEVSPESTSPSYASNEAHESDLVEQKPGIEVTEESVAVRVSRESPASTMRNKEGDLR